MKNRLFLLGDSFTDNLYSNEIFQLKVNPSRKGSDVQKYVKHIIEQTNEYPLYFDDWFRKWGYDVFNFGLGGCSIYHTFNQFAKIDNNFIKGDRIIVNWTSPQRLDWFVDNGDLFIIQGTHNCYHDKPDAKAALIEQDLLRYNSLKNSDGVGYLKKNTIPFMSKLVDLHKQYKPIQWSPFGDVSNLFSNQPWYFYEIANPIFKDYIAEYDSLYIWGDSDGKCEDLHYSRYGNYYSALVFKTIIEHKSSTPYYISDSSLMDKVLDTVKNNRPKFKKINWKNLN